MYIVLHMTKSLFLKSSQPTTRENKKSLLTHPILSPMVTADCDSSSCILPRSIISKQDKKIELYFKILILK